MANGDLVRFRQGSRADVVSTAKQAGQLLFATYEDEVITTSGAESFVQGDIYFDLSDGPSGIRVNLANDVDKARTLFSGQTSTSDTAGNWTATIDGITKLYDGLTIVLRLNTSYNSTYNSLNVNGLGSKLVWYRKGSRLTSHVPSGAEVLLVYRTVAGSYTTPSSGSRTDIPRGTTCTDGWILLTNYVDGNTVPSAYCSTGASTTAKTASCSGYSATANTYIHIVFSNTNTANVPTLNINSKGAKPIYLNGQPVSSSNKDIKAGSYIAYYDGTAYYLRNDGILPGRIENALTADSTTLANEAVKLQTGGTLQVDLSRTTPSSLFDGTGNIHNIGVNGVLDLDYGGTNATDGAYTDNMLTYVSTVSNVRAFTSASQLYTTGSNLGVNKTSVTSGYSLDVSGKSLFDDIVLNSGKTIKVGTLTLGGNTDALSKTITSSSTLYLTSASGCSLIFSTGSTEAGRFDPSGHFIPGTNNTFNLGSSQKVWKKLFVYDIEASNAITTGGLTTSGDVSFTGQGFNYSGIQAGSSNSSTPIWFASATANGTPVYDSDFTYNPSTNTLTVGTISGAVAGNAATATKLATARILNVNLERGQNKTNDANRRVSEFDGTADVENITVTGILPIEFGGTGATTNDVAMRNLMGNTAVGSKLRSIYWNGTNFAENITSLTNGTKTAAVTTSPYKPELWKFDAGIVPQDGDIIMIKSPGAGHDYGVFLSLDNGTHYYPIGYRGNGTERLTTHFAEGCQILLVFEEFGRIDSVYPATGGTARVNVMTGGIWSILNYDSGNNGDWNLRQYNLKAAAAITAYQIIGGTDTGYKPITTGNAFDIRYAVLYAGSNISNGSEGNNNYIHNYAINLKDSSNNNITLTKYTNIYIKGTLDGTMFTPYSNSNPFVQTLPITDDGFYYYYIGRAYSTSALTFDTTGRNIFVYKDGAIRSYADYAPIRDSQNGQNITFSPSSTALTSSNTIAAWDGYALKSISNTNIVQGALGASAIGGASNPIYWTGSAFAASNASIADDESLMYMSSGTLTASNADIGDADQPVYLFHGKISAATPYSSLFTAFSTSGNTISSTIGGTTKTTSAVTDVANAWTGGTTAGPELQVTVNGVAATKAAIPAASSSASGIVTTSAQTFAGIKTLTASLNRYYASASTDPMITLRSKDVDATFLFMGHASATDGTISNGYKIIYKGSGTAPANNFILQTTNSVDALTVNENGKASFGSDVEISGTLYVGDTSTTRDILPYYASNSTTATYKLGSSTKRWLELWLQAQSSCRNNGIRFTKADGTLTANIGADTSGGLGLYSSSKIYLRPNLTATAGVELSSTTFIPATTNAISLGDSSHRWSKLYIGTADTYGANDIPIWWNNGKPEAITTLNPLNGGTGVQNLTAFRALYFDSVFKASSNIIINPASDYQIETIGTTESTVFSVDKKVELRYNTSTQALDFVFV